MQLMGIQEKPFFIQLRHERIIGMYNIGIIGCGKIAQIRHIPEYEACEEAKLYGFYDLNIQRAQELAEKYNGKAYASVEELLKDKEIDAVSVCTSNNTHAEISIAAMKAGKHVLCEKPMAITLEECERMVQAAKEENRYLMIDQNQRRAKAHVKAKEMIQDGKIGKILTFRTTFGHGGPETWSIDPGKATWFFDKNKAAMGAMADLGIHKTDLIQYLTSQTVTETQAFITTLDKKDASDQLIGVDDNAICIYKMSGGAVGTMTASWTYYGEEDNSTVLYGTEGIMKMYEDPAHSLVVIGKTGSTEYYDVDTIQTNDNQTSSGIMKEFIDCISKGKEPEISGESVLTAMRAVFGSLESSEKGMPVKVNQ